MINVIHENDEGRITRAHRRVPRATFIGLCLIWHTIRRFLSRANFGSGSIQYLELHMPGYIEDMGPKEFLRCLLVLVSPFGQYGPVSSLCHHTLNDVVRMADFMGGHTILIMFRNQHFHHEDILMTICDYLQCFNLTPCIHFRKPSGKLAIMDQSKSMYEKSTMLAHLKRRKICKGK